MLNLDQQGNNIFKVTWIIAQRIYTTNIYMELLDISCDIAEFWNVYSLLFHCGTAIYFNGQPEDYSCGTTKTSI